MFVFGLCFNLYFFKLSAGHGLFSLYLCLVHSFVLLLNALRPIYRTQSVKGLTFYLADNHAQS